ncbi:MAG: hemerythrin domain-containing protein [Deltaproteobacteria bacterium]|nr:hemerythrin domain-containing protein [Deltaproteobacteria bacterium]
MSSSTVDIKYRCLHPSCCVNCREGLITVEAELFDRLIAESAEKDVIKSPKGACRLGFRQPYKIIKVERQEAPADAAPIQPYVTSPTKADEGPIALLMAEHRDILKLLSVIEEHLRIRDIDALWVSTVDLENALNLHSGRKEEDVVLPILSEILPFGDGLGAIVKEEHREIVSLLHAFRAAMQDGDINDGIIRSMIVSLKSHIRKEDYEFFSLVEGRIDEETKHRLLAGMAEAEAAFVKAVPGDRAIKTDAQKAAATRRGAYYDEMMDVRSLAKADTGCCH